MTELGKFLRKLRIDKAELMGDMAKKLNISTSYLSSVEIGTRRAPDIWVNLIAEIYNLDFFSKEELKIAYEHSKNEVSINLLNADNKRKDVALQFARSFEEFDDDELNRLLAMFKSKDGVHEDE